MPISSLARGAEREKAKSRPGCKHNPPALAVIRRDGGGVLGLPSQHPQHGMGHPNPATACWLLAVMEGALRGREDAPPKSRNRTKESNVPKCRVSHALSFRPHMVGSSSCPGLGRGGTQCYWPTIEPLPANPCSLISGHSRALAAMTSTRRAGVEGRRELQAAAHPRFHPCYYFVATKQNIRCPLHTFCWSPAVPARF